MDHQVDHVQDLGWKGKKDRFLLPDVSRRGYDAFLTNDSAQLDSAEETRAIRDSGIHHSRYRQDTRRGLDGFALAMAAVMAAMRQVVRELESADGQRLVAIQTIQPTKRHQTTDPRIEPPPYWGRRGGAVPSHEGAGKTLRAASRSRRRSHKRFINRMTTQDGTRILGGVGTGRDYQSHAIFYVGVPDVEAALRKAENLGGTWVMGPAQNEGGGVVVGHFTEGNLIGVAGPA